MPLPENVAGVLIDIEGTTTPITFVCDVLFPYAADRLDAYCARVDDDPRIADAVALLRAEHAGGDDGRCSCVRRRRPVRALADGAGPQVNRAQGAAGDHPGLSQNQLIF